MFKGVIFDVDGTLVDSVDLHAAAWQNALRHLGHPLPYKKVRQQIGKGADQLLPALLPAAGPTWYSRAAAMILSRRFLVQTIS